MLLACESVYWVNMNADIKNTMKQCTTCLDYQQTQPHEKTTSYNILCKPWEVAGADISSVKKQYTTMYCRLLQQVPFCEESLWSFS